MIVIAANSPESGLSSTWCITFKLIYPSKNWDKIDERQKNAVKTIWKERFGKGQASKQFTHVHTTHRTCNTIQYNTIQNKGSSNFQHTPHKSLYVLGVLDNMYISSVFLLLTKKIDYSPSTNIMALSATYCSKTHLDIFFFHLVLFIWLKGQGIIITLRYL